jgi:hypothetical protein
MVSTLHAPTGGTDVSGLEEFSSPGRLSLERAEIQIEEAQIEVLATVEEISGEGWQEAR